MFALLLTLFILGLTSIIHIAFFWVILACLLFSLLIYFLVLKRQTTFPWKWRILCIIVTLVAIMTTVFLTRPATDPVKSTITIPYTAHGTVVFTDKRFSYGVDEITIPTSITSFTAKDDGAEVFFSKFEQADHGLTDDQKAAEASSVQASDRSWWLIEPAASSNKLPATWNSGSYNWFRNPPFGFGSSDNDDPTDTPTGTNNVTSLLSALVAGKSAEDALAAAKALRSASTDPDKIAFLDAIIATLQVYADEISALTERLENLQAGETIADWQPPVDSSAKNPTQRLIELTNKISELIGVSPLELTAIALDRKTMIKIHSCISEKDPIILAIWLDDLRLIAEDILGAKLLDVKSLSDKMATDKSFMKEMHTLYVQALNDHRVKFKVVEAPKNGINSGIYNGTIIYAKSSGVGGDLRAIEITSDLGDHSLKLIRCANPLKEPPEEGEEEEEEEGDPKDISLSPTRDDTVSNIGKSNMQNTGVTVSTSYGNGPEGIASGYQPSEEDDKAAKAIADAEAAVKAAKLAAQQAEEKATAEKQLAEEKAAAEKQLKDAKTAAERRAAREELERVENSEDAIEAQENTSLGSKTSTSTKKEVTKEGEENLSGAKWDD